MVTKGSEATADTSRGDGGQASIGTREIPAFWGVQKWPRESRLSRNDDGSGTWDQMSGWRGEKNDMVKGLILGILLAILLIAGGAYFFISSGHAPVATSAPPIPFEKTFARLGLNAYLDKLPHPEPQVPADEANMVAGAKVYKEQCATCHGLPGEPKGAIALGMYPAPPQLFHGVGVTTMRGSRTGKWKTGFD